MILIRLSGGIGNQLFQYAFGEYVHLKTGHTVNYDIGAFNYIDNRNVSLDVFNIDVKRIYNNKNFFSSYLSKKRELLKFFFKINYKNKYISERKFDSSSLKDKQGIVYLDGYWQSNKFIDEMITYKPDILIPKKLIPFKLEKIQNDISNKISVSVHVRRGDYFSEQYINIYGVCDKDYYNRAINRIQQITSIDCFYVFSDDFQWVKENLIFPIDTIYVENREVNDFWYIHLMSLCKHNIISNSSFSWWGAYLNRNKDKIVIAPVRWTLKDTKTISLESWIKI